MIGKVETINGVKQITPLDDTLIPNISPSTPNNSILQYENGVVKSAGYTTGEVVRYVGNFGTMSLSDIYNTYATQNTIIYKGYFNWGDTRNPLYGNGANTGEVTCYDWNLVFEDVSGRRFYWYNTNNQWIQPTGINQVDKYICQPKGGAGYFNLSAPYSDDVTDTKYGDGRHHVTGLFVLGAGDTNGQGIWLSAIPRGDMYNGNYMWLPVFLGDGRTCTAFVGSGTADPTQPTVYKGQVNIWNGGFAPTLSQNTTAFVDFWYQE